MSLYYFTPHIIKKHDRNMEIIFKTIFIKYSKININKSPQTPIININRIWRLGDLGHEHQASRINGDLKNKKGTQSPPKSAQKNIYYK